MFTRHVCPRAGTFDQIRELQTAVCCGRIPVCPGDWIVGDADGVVVPAPMREQVFAKAAEVHAREAALAVQLKQGKGFTETLKAMGSGHPR